MLPFLRHVATLAKPKIIVLLAITCLCGALVATKGNVDVLLLQLIPILGSLAGLIIGASGANTINMWYDRDIDPLMRRTQHRPLPMGHMSPRSVLILGIAELTAGTLLAWATANVLAASMVLAGSLFYVFIYTIWLKRRSVQNIVIGGAAGAFPPLVGWAAVQGDLAHPLPWLMFAIIFFWTPPHFWALALMSNADYTKAKIPMYPVVYGEAATRVAILRYLVFLIAVTLLGALMYPLSYLYLLAAAALGAWWLHTAWRLLHAPQTTAQNVAPARRVFLVSLSYLALIFAAMVVDAFM